MEHITIKKGTEKERKFLHANLFGLDKITNEELKESVVTAWTTAIGNSTYSSIEEIPYSLHAPSYNLLDHVNEVTTLGLILSEFTLNFWKPELNMQELILTLILHDVDKPLLSTGSKGTLSKSELSRNIPHGVLGSYILQELKFPERVVFAVGTHAANSPLHGNSMESLILHYADFFSADHAIIKEGGEAFFQKGPTGDRR